MHNGLVCAILSQEVVKKFKVYRIFTQSKLGAKKIKSHPWAITA